MSSCCDQSDTPTKSAGTLTVALAGNPNSGKTTIFNALTGLRQKVANYPGVTVEKKTGRCKLPDGQWIDLIDLPGTYSLISRSPDEHVAMEVLRGLRKDVRRPDAVIVVVDASNLQRNLYLVSQLIETGRPMVVALNMTDIAERRGLKVSPEALEKAIGVPVIPIVGHKRQGIDALKSAIARATVAPMPNWLLPPAMQEELMLVGGGLAILDSAEDSGLRTKSQPEKVDLSSTQSSVLSPQSSRTRAWICREDSDRRLDRYQALAERLLIGDRAADVAEFANRQPVSRLLDHATHRLRNLGIDPMQADVEAHYRWIEEVAVASTTGGVGASPTLELEEATRGRGAHATVEGATLLDYAPGPNLSERVDRIFLHKVWGLLVFTAIMAALFISIFWLAQPIMDAITNGIKTLGTFTSSRMSDGPLKDLITDGIFAGVGTVITFVPQIALLFMFISILEDTGYLARAAFLMDRLLSKVGLHGKSFIPLLSSFACAIPGIMATRTIENRKDRLATIFIAPFMSCSARLPVYALLIGAFFAKFSAITRGSIMLSMYALGIIAAVATAWVFKRTMLKGAPAAFILELPTYKIPQASEVARQVWKNTSEFIKKAGTTIFCMSVILWAMTYYPRLPQARIEQLKQTSSREYQTQTITHLFTMLAKSGKLDVEFPGHAADLATLQRAFTPIQGQISGLTVTSSNGTTVQANPNQEAASPSLIHQQAIVNGVPMDSEDQYVDKAVASAQLQHSIAGRFGHIIEPAIRPLGFDWKMGVGLVGAFAAREVFVSTMAITYAAGDEDNTADLATAMRNDQYTSGKPVWTPLVAISLLVWFVLAMQCMSTIAIVKRETGGWAWPIAMLVYMNALAYVVCLAVFQIGHLWFA